MKAIIFGAGRMGRRFVQIARNNDLDVVGICDVSDAALAIASTEYGLPESALFLDAETMASTAGAEVAIVATTAPAHHPYSMLAMRNGARYLLCEKPMAHSLARCDEMTAEAKERDVVFGVNHQMRHIGEYKRFKELADSPQFGGMHSMVIQSGNAGLSMNGLHFFEGFQFIADAKITRVTGWIRPEKAPNPRGVEFNDPGGSIRVETSAGHSLYLDMDTRNGHGMKVVLGAAYGQFVADLLSGSITVANRLETDRAKTSGLYGTDGETSVESYVPMNAIDSSTIVLREMLKGHAGNFVTAAEARHLVSILVAANVSSEQGNRTIDLASEPLPLDREFPWA